MKRFFYLMMVVWAVAACKKEDALPEDAYVYTGPLGDITKIISEERLTKAQVLELIPAELRTFTAPRFDIRVFVVEYKAENKDGQVVKASGVIVVPETDSFALPMSSYQHGTILKRTDAPSVSKGLEYVVNLAIASNAGMVGCLPDYLGLGTGEGLHLYLHPREQANSVRDLMRAARKLVKEEQLAALNGQIFLFGYSQGGHATMAAQRQLELENPKEFKLTATAPMAGPYALSRTSQFNIALDSVYYPNPFYLPYLAVSIFNSFDVYDSYSDLFKYPYDSIIPAVINGNYGYEVNNKFPKYVSTMLVDSVRLAIKNNPNHPVRLAAREYDLVDNWTPRAPMKLYHCTGDDNVYYDNAVYADSAFRSRGADVELLDMGTANHQDCAPSSILFASLWFIDLVELKPIK